MGREKNFPFNIVQAHRAAAVEVLRQRIALLEGRQVTLEKNRLAPEAGWNSGVAAIDALLPAGGLGAGAVHEISPVEYGDRAAALGFGLALLARRRLGGPILWCGQRQQLSEAGLPYGPGLLAAGFAPENLIVMMATRQSDVLWAIEEGLNAGAMAAVIAEVTDLDFTTSRRLGLAAQAGKTPALLLFGPGHEGATAAETRWRVAAAPSAPHPWDARAPGRPCWQAALVKCRGGQATGYQGAWRVEWDDETGDFRLAAAMAGRSAAPQPGAAGQELWQHSG